MSHSFHIGQKVVCVDASHTTAKYGTVAPQLVEGHTYVVRGHRSSPCCGRALIDVGVPSDSCRSTCPLCLHTYNNDGAARYAASRFRPLDTLEEQIERIQEEGAPVELETVSA